jgi:hypothetical protein
MITRFAFLRLLSLSLFLTLLLPTPAQAWWDMGHKIVARIALDEVHPGTAAQIGRLLRQSATLDTPTCPAATIEDLSVWPDCIKSLRDRFSYTSNWHYQNINVCEPFDPEAACPDGNCVSAQIERSARLLRDRSLPVRERVQALAFLVHFVGDLHMPIHAGDRGDRGGNRFHADYGAIRSNLHSIWDGHLADRALTTPPAGPRGLLADVTRAEREAMRAGTLADWHREAWEVARNQGYGTLLDDPCAPQPDPPPVLTETQIQALIPVVRRQVLRGGLRLARMLDEALG